MVRILGWLRERVGLIGVGRGIGEMHGVNSCEPFMNSVVN